MHQKKTHGICTRILALVMTICMTLGMFAGTVQAADRDDVTGHWAEAQIRSWLSQGLIKGYSDGTVRPNASITRGEFSAIVNRVFGFSEAGEIAFTDVPETHWAHEDVAIAVKTGYMAGQGKGIFGVDKPITRQEMAVVIARLLDRDMTATDTDYTDADEFAAWAAGAIAALAADNTMKGYSDGSFRPANNVTRAEAVTALDKVIPGEAEEEVEETEKEAVSDKKEETKEESKEEASEEEASEEEANDDGSRIISGGLEGMAEALGLQLAPPLEMEEAEDEVQQNAASRPVVDLPSSSVKPVAPGRDDAEEEDGSLTIISNADDPYSPYLTYEGVAQSQIVLPEGASDLEKFAAEELQSQLELVTGAALPINSRDFAEREFTMVTSKKFLYVTEAGYHPVVLNLKNPTDEEVLVSVAQIGYEEGMPQLIIRGEDELGEGEVLLAPRSEANVSGLIKVEDPSAFASYAVEVSSFQNGEQIASCEVLVVTNGNVFDASDFENGAGSWIGGAVNTTKAYTGKASYKMNTGAENGYSQKMELLPGYLYTLRFWARSDAPSAGVKVRVRDYDANGEQLATSPMSLYSEIFTYETWTYREYRFVPNVTELDEYAYSVLDFVGTSEIWLDDVELICCGVAPSDDMADLSDFEQAIPNTTINENTVDAFAAVGVYTADTFGVYGNLVGCSHIERDDVLFGEQAMMVQHYENFGWLFCWPTIFEGKPGGTTYTLSFWAKAEENGSYFNFWVLENFEDGNSNMIPYKIPISTEWQRYEYTFHVSEKAQTWQMPFIFENVMPANHKGLSTMTWYDEFSLRCTDVVDEMGGVPVEPAPMQLIYNGSFEDSEPVANSNLSKFRYWESLAENGWGTADKNQKKEGAQSLKLSWTGSAPTTRPIAQSAKMDLPDSSRTTCRLSFWAKASKTGQKLTVKINENRGGDSWAAGEEATFSLTTSWKLYTKEITINPKKFAGFRYAMFEAYLGKSTGSGSIWLDNMVFATYTAEPETPAEEVIKPEIIMPEQPGIPAPTYSGLTILLATPQSYPMLEDLFADDLEWIGESDGFAVRQIGGAIYIFGNEPRGVLNGVYDFLEENTGIIWFRANDTAYDEQPTLEPQATDYREKSPFGIRASNLGGGINEASMLMHSRNKYNYLNNMPAYNTYRPSMVDMGLGVIVMNHNASTYITQSTVYLNDPDKDKYWNTVPEDHPYYEIDRGNGAYFQCNYWIDETAEAMIEGARKEIDSSPVPLKYFGVGINDNWFMEVEGYSDKPFNYGTEEDPKWVYPDPDWNEQTNRSDEGRYYYSTVFYSWLNKVARGLKESHPDVTILTYAYFASQIPPACELEDNIAIVWCDGANYRYSPYDTSIYATVRANPLHWSNAKNNEWVEGFREKSNPDNPLLVYTYWHFDLASTNIERPLAKSIQWHLQYYAKMGNTGMMPEGFTDGPERAEDWALNQLDWYLYAKLQWDPWADVDALAEHFCNTVYGKEAGPYMYEYYQLLEEAWFEGDGDPFDTPNLLMDFAVNSGDIKAMDAALDKAWKAVEDNEVYKKRMKYIYENFEAVYLSAAPFKTEDTAALYTTAGKEAIINDYDFTSDIWKDAPVATNFLNKDTLVTVPGTRTELRMLWDERYLYVAYNMYDTSIDDMPASSNWYDGTHQWWKKSDDVETYLTLDTSCQNYYQYATNPTGMSLRHLFENGYRRHDTSVCDWDSKVYIVNVDNEEEDRWVCIQAISFESIGLKGDATPETEIFAYFYRLNHSEAGALRQMGWNGAPVWRGDYLRHIPLLTEPVGGGEAVEPEA